MTCNIAPPCAQKTLPSVMTIHVFTHTGPEVQWADDKTNSTQSMDNSWYGAPSAITEEYGHWDATQVIGRIAICGTDGIVHQCCRFAEPQIAEEAVETERELIEWAFDRIRNGTQYSGLCSKTLPFILAGWRLNAYSLRLLINRAMKYRIPVPFEDMLPEPGVRWARSRNLVDVDVLYGHNHSVDPVSALTFWGLFPAGIYIGDRAVYPVQIVKGLRIGDRAVYPVQIVKGLRDATLMWYNGCAEPVAVETLQGLPVPETTGAETFKTGVIA